LLPLVLKSLLKIRDPHTTKTTMAKTIIRPSNKSRPFRVRTADSGPLGSLSGVELIALLLRPKVFWLLYSMSYYLLHVYTLYLMNFGSIITLAMAALAPISPSPTAWHRPGHRAQAATRSRNHRCPDWVRTYAIHSASHGEIRARAHRSGGSIGEKGTWAWSSAAGASARYSASPSRDRDVKL